MDHLTCGSGARWCARADAIFDVPDIHVLEVDVDDVRRLVLTVESVSWRRHARPAGLRALFRPGHAAAMAGADLALPRTAVRNDPLYKDSRAAPPRRRTPHRGQQAKLSRCLDAGDPQDEVNLTWQCYQQLRSIYHAAPATGREIARKVLDSFHTCPIPEVARLGRTLRA